MRRATTDRYSALRVRGRELIGHQRIGPIAVIAIERIVYLCSACDAEALLRYHRNRPNPLMPDELPTSDSEG